MVEREDTGGGAERRDHPRITVEMWVEEIRPGERHYQHSGNLSLGGIYIDHTIPHPRGTVVLLKFTLPGESEPIALHGEVIADPDERRLGMHIKFLGLDEDRAVHERLRAFIDGARK